MYIGVKNNELAEVDYKTDYLEAEEEVSTDDVEIDE